MKFYWKYEHFPSWKPNQKLCQLPSGHFVMELLKSNWIWNIIRWRWYSKWLCKSIQILFTIQLYHSCCQGSTYPTVQWPWASKTACCASGFGPRFFKNHIYGLVQDCSNSSALAMELLQSCTKPSIHNLLRRMLNFGSQAGENLGDTLSSGYLNTMWFICLCVRHHKA